MEGGPSFFLRHRHYIEGPVVVFYGRCPLLYKYTQPFLYVNWCANVVLGIFALEIRDKTRLSGCIGDELRNGQANRFVATDQIFLTKLNRNGCQLRSISSQVYSLCHCAIFSSSSFLVVYSRHYTF